MNTVESAGARKSGLSLRMLVVLAALALAIAGLFFVHSGLGRVRDPEPVKETVLLVSVKSFGAIGDGRTDDRDAILKALRSGHAVFFPRGTYLIGAPIDFGALRLREGWAQPNVVLVGEGAGLSRLLFRGDGTLLVGGRTAPAKGGYEQRLTIRELSFLGTPLKRPKPVRSFGRFKSLPNEFAGTSSAQGAVYWEFGGASVIEKSEFTDFDTAVSTELGYGLTVRNSIFKYNGIAILLSKAVTTSVVEQNTIERNDIGIAMWICSQIRIANNILQGNYGGADIVSYNWNSQISITENYFEASPVAFFHAGDSEGEFISNNFFFERNKGLTVNIGPLANNFSFVGNRIQSFTSASSAQNILLENNTDDTKNGLVPFTAFEGAGASTLRIIDDKRGRGAGM